MKWYDKESWSDWSDDDWKDFNHWIKTGPKERVHAYLSGGITTTKLTASSIIGKKFNEHE